MHFKLFWAVSHVPIVIYYNVPKLAMAGMLAQPTLRRIIVSLLSVIAVSAILAVQSGLMLRRWRCRKHEQCK